MPTQPPAQFVPPPTPAAPEAAGPREVAETAPGESGEASIARDYNPDVARSAKRRRASTTPALLSLAVGAVGFIVVHPFDLRILEHVSSVGASLGGDLRRELFAWQQYGQGFAIIVTALLIWLLDPPRRRRLLDLGLAVALAQVASSAGKMLIGRPRPRPEFMDPHSFPGPLGMYPIRVDGQWRLVHAWDRAAGAGADLWSMPSSHTLFAVMFSAVLSVLYPRARWVFAGLAVMVCIARVLFGAHWPTDVVVGAAVGLAIGWSVARNGWGVRLLDWLWLRLVDRHATPAWRG